MIKRRRGWAGWARSTRQKDKNMNNVAPTELSVNGFVEKNILLRMIKHIEGSMCEIHTKDDLYKADEQRAQDFIRGYDCAMSLVMRHGYYVPCLQERSCYPLGAQMSWVDGDSHGVLEWDGNGWKREVRAEAARGGVKNAP